MTAYIIRRSLLLIPTVLLVTILVFLTIRFIPGDVVDVILGEMGTFSGNKVDREAIEEKLGLNVPIHVQYRRWIGDIILHGSLGESLRSGKDVAGKIFGRVWVTFEISFLALILALLVGIPTGIYSSIRQDTIGDYIGRSIAIVFLSLYPVSGLGQW